MSSETIDGAGHAAIYDEIEKSNMEVVLLEKAPRVAVYIPPKRGSRGTTRSTLALDYAEIPFEPIWDEEVLDGDLTKYDWLHLHHEDFTGQYGKFYASYRSAPGTRAAGAVYEGAAHAAGFAKVWQHKQAVARADPGVRGAGRLPLRDVLGHRQLRHRARRPGVDIADAVYDGDPPDPGAQQKLDFSQTLAFTDFTLEMNPLVYEFSNIDMTEEASLRGQEADFFTLFEFSAKEDPGPDDADPVPRQRGPRLHGADDGLPEVRCSRSDDRPGARSEGTDEVQYVHGNFGKGTFTFYGGHDPEDYQHKVGDPPTDLALHKNSPGYRLILNNVLFPAAKKKEQKT